MTTISHPVIDTATALRNVSLILRLTLLRSTDLGILFLLTIMPKRSNPRVFGLARRSSELEFIRASFLSNTESNS